jgi:hypothetical protein
MCFRVVLGATIALCITVLSASVVFCAGPKQKTVAAVSPAPQQIRQAVERGLVFLEQDAWKWRKEHQCATCHHGGMTVWAISEAKNQGYSIAAKSLGEMVKWTKGQFVPAPDKPPDLRPGFNIPSLAAAYLVISTRTNRQALTQEEIDQIGRAITVRQEADGAWPVPPPANAPRPVFESREVMALWCCMALSLSVPANPTEAATQRAGREKAAAWLDKREVDDTTQAAALRLLVEIRQRKPTKLLQVGIDRLVSRQNADGGWSQIKSLPSDAYATGQSLYVLSLAGLANDRPEIRRAASFLIANQRKDGSWPMTPRSSPERKASKNPAPIIHFGSAWATLGLVRAQAVAVLPATSSP